ncbi:single-stranded DNA-binding protein [Streptomyces sp. NPDC046985]|uniref:single-stranded DNA-binding protein n=1 Tax=Streptomyces sp. NPDC046985 TaxID=3155377 RepID=UPI0033FE7773
MNETMICAVGNVATQPLYRDPASGASARFRLAVTSRYWDREKSAWTDGHTNFFTVWANRQLAANAMASLNVGDPVIVQGRLKVRTETRDGATRTWADVDAVAIGHDLARGTAAFRRSSRADAGAAASFAPASAPPEPSWETPPPGRPPARTDAEEANDAAAGADAAEPAAAGTGARERREPVAVT